MYFLRYFFLCNSKYALGCIGQSEWPQCNGRDRCLYSGVVVSDFFLAFLKLFSIFFIPRLFYCLTILLCSPFCKCVIACVCVCVLHALHVMIALSCSRSVGTWSCTLYSFKRSIIMSAAFLKRYVHACICCWQTHFSWTPTIYPL